MPETMKTVAPKPTFTFNDILELVETLSEDEQEVLIDLLKRRRIEARREEMVQNVIRAREEYEKGSVFRGTVDEVIAELNR
jgi:predicted transcriptional regulator